MQARAPKLEGLLPAEQAKLVSRELRRPIAAADEPQPATGNSSVLQKGVSKGDKQVLAVSAADMDSSPCFGPVVSGRELLMSAHKADGGMLDYLELVGTNHVSGATHGHADEGASSAERQGASAAGRSMSCDIVTVESPRGRQVSFSVNALNFGWFGADVEENSCALSSEGDPSQALTCGATGSCKLAGRKDSLLQELAVEPSDRCVFGKCKPVAALGEDILHSSENGEDSNARFEGDRFQALNERIDGLQREFVSKLTCIDEKVVLLCWRCSL